MRCLPLLSQVIPFALALLLAGTSHGGEAPPDPAITVYGTLNPDAPAELEVFAFLVGKWVGTGKFRDAAGKYTEYELEWIGRYMLDGMAIADEIRMAGAQGGGVQGISFRHFDADREGWTVEYLNFVRSFLRKQVSPGVGSVTRDGERVTIAQAGPNGSLSRELFTVRDGEHFTYSLDFSQDGGQTWDGNVVMELERQE
jgi:hypothetical protein